MTDCTNFVMTGLPPVITTMSGIVRRAATAADVVRERFAQRRYASTRAVTGLAVGDGCVHRLHDVRSHGHVEIAEVERVDRVACRPPRRGGLGDRERGLGAQSGKSLGQAHRATCLYSGAEQRTGRPGAPTGCSLGPQPPFGTRRSLLNCRRTASGMVLLRDVDGAPLGCRPSPKQVRRTG